MAFFVSKTSWHAIRHVVFGGASLFLVALDCDTRISRSRTMLYGGSRGMERLRRRRDHVSQSTELEPGIQWRARLACRSAVAQAGRQGTPLAHRQPVKSPARAPALHGVRSLRQKRKAPCEAFCVSCHRCMIDRLRPAASHDANHSTISLHGERSARIIIVLTLSLR